MSSTHIAMLDAIDEDRCVVGVSGIDYISNPDIQARRDSVGDVGYEGNINLRTAARSTPPRAALRRERHGSSMEGKLKELIASRSCMLALPGRISVGQSRWLVALSEITGETGGGREKYLPISPLDIKLLRKRVTDQAIDAPSVMLNTPYGDSWFMPSTESYVARMVKDAGGDYIYKKNTGNASGAHRPRGSLPAGPLQADMWLHVGMANTLDELRAACPKFTDTRCFRGG